MTTKHKNKPLGLIILFWSPNVLKKAAEGLVSIEKSYIPTHSYSARILRQWVKSKREPKIWETAEQPTSQGLDQNKTNMVPSTQLALLYFFSSSRMVKKKKGTFIHHLTRLLAPINIYCRLWCQIIEIRMRPPGTSRNFSPFSILLPTRKKNIPTHL